MTADNFARCPFLVAAMLLAAAPSAQASVEISSKPTHNMNCAGGVCTPTAKNADLNATDLANMLAASDVKVVTGSGAVTITVSSSFSWTSSHRLTLDANLNVSFRAPVVVAGQGAVTIVTNDGGTGGDLLFFPGASLDFWDTGSSLIIDGNSYMLVGDIKTLATDIAANRSGFYALAKPYDASVDGTYKSSPVSKRLNGTVEGLGNTISHLSISAGGYIGLFMWVNKRGTVRDLSLNDVNVSGGAGADAVIGALAGRSIGRVMNCFASGTVSNSGAYGYVGGLIGTGGGTIINSGSTVVVSMYGYGTRAGGLLGASGGKIKESYATGSVTGFYQYQQQAGGLVGLVDGSATIADSYATGAVTVNSSGSAGGLVGIIFGSPIFQNAYSTGAIIGGPDAIIGGLIGQYVDGASSSISNAYWDLDTSGISNPAQGAGNVANDPGITGLTDTQFKSSLPAGFDKKVWKEKANINNGYPYLLTNPPQ